MKQKSLGVNALLNGVKQCCSIIFPLITFPYISRVLGSNGYGKYSFSNSVTNYFILLAALGIYTYAIREGAKIRDDQKAINQFCSQVFSINVCSAAISLLLLFSMVFFLPKFSGYKAYILIQSISIVMAVIGTDWINGIFEDYFYITVRYIAVQCICLLAIYASLFTNCVLIVNGQEKYCLEATVVSAIVNVAMNLVLMPRLGMIGAAITTVLAEFVNCMMQIYFSRTFFDWKMLDIKSVESCLCGSVAIGIICILCNQYFDRSLWRMISASLISVVVYAGILIVMKNPTVHDYICAIAKKRKD